MMVGAVPLLFLISVPLTLTLNFHHHDQNDMEKFLIDMNTRYPDITHLHSIGKSVDGTDLWVMVIGQCPRDHVTLRPHVKYIGNMHGNEVVGREVLLHLIKHLVTNYGISNTITRFLNTTTIHILPTMNPDGYADAYENCIGYTGRNNRGDLDLNRNFPDYFVVNTACRQPETRAVMKWVNEQQFVLSANLHGGVLVASYPFDNYNNVTDFRRHAVCPDDDVFHKLSMTYSFTHPTMHLGQRCFNDSREESFKDGITNGALWYPMTGGMQDYNYLYVGCMEITIEISCCKYPPATQMPSFWVANRDALIHYLQQVHMGVKGLVTDENNNPMVGTVVSVKGREIFKVKTTQYGEYWRLLLPGDYVLQISSPNFSEISKPFSVVEGEVLRLDIIVPTATDTFVESVGNLWVSSFVINLLVAGFWLCLI